jgi:purine-binding chemotaxis protein CheW
MNVYSDVLDGSEFNSIFAIKEQLAMQQVSEFADREQFIGCRLGDEEFLLTISTINEIIMPPQITWVPNGPNYVEGVFNLRGSILPVLNLRKMLGMQPGQMSMGTRIIVVQSEDIGIKVGLLVDGITFVIALLPEDIEKQSLPNAAGGHDLISGIAKQSRGIHGIIDISKIMLAAAEGRDLKASEGEAAA